MRRDKKGRFKPTNLIERLTYSPSDMRKWALYYELYKGDKEAATRIISQSTAEEIKAIIKGSTLLDDILENVVGDLFSGFYDHTGEYDQENRQHRCPLCKNAT